MPRKSEAQEPQVLSSRAQSPCFTAREVSAPKRREWPQLAATREKPSQSNEDPVQPAINSIKKKSNPYF